MTVLRLTLFYMAILLAIVFLHGRGGVDLPHFTYEGQ
jgi:hypothetical protein